MKNELTWLTGWKSIAAAMDVAPSTAKRWAKRFRMPAKRGPTGRPAITLGDLSTWRRNLPEAEYPKCDLR